MLLDIFKFMSERVTPSEVESKRQICYLGSFFLYTENCHELKTSFSRQLNFTMSCIIKNDLSAVKIHTCLKDIIEGLVQQPG